MRHGTLALLFCVSLAHPAAASPRVVERILAGRTRDKVLTSWLDKAYRPAGAKPTRRGSLARTEEAYVRRFPIAHGFQWTIQMKRAKSAIRHGRPIRMSLSFDLPVISRSPDPGNYPVPRDINQAHARQRSFVTSTVAAAVQNAAASAGLYGEVKTAERVLHPDTEQEQVQIELDVPSRDSRKAMTFFRKLEAELAGSPTPRAEPPQTPSALIGPSWDIRR